MKTVEQKRAEQRERHIQQHMKTCVHFTGIQHEKCNAGVNYHAQFGSGQGCFANIACTQAYPRADFPVKECPSVQYSSREEAELHENEVEQRSARASKAMWAAHDDAKTKGFKKGNGGQGDLKCPLCPGGMLRYSVASYNGHMHASCTTPNCISWME